MVALVSNKGPGRHPKAGKVFAIFLGLLLLLILPSLVAHSNAFLFGLVLVIFAYGIAIGFVFALPEGYGRRLPAWMKVDGIGQLKASLSEVVIVVLIVMFARVVVESGGAFTYEMLVLPASILMIAIALRMIDLGSGHAPNGNGDGHGKANAAPAKKDNTSENGPH